MGKYKYCSEPCEKCRGWGIMAENEKPCEDCNYGRERKRSKKLEAQLEMAVEAMDKLEFTAGRNGIMRVGENVQFLVGRLKKEI